MDPVIDTCDQGHKYARLPDHPYNKDGRPRCPYCMSIGLDRALSEVSELQEEVKMWMNRTAALFPYVPDDVKVRDIQQTFNEISIEKEN